MAHHSVLLTLVLVCVTVSYCFDRRRFPGPYCETRPREQCCPGRDDQCTVPIHDTLCYCDQFCNEHSVEDCCPDYRDRCTAPVPAPDPRIENQCIKDGRYYQVGETVKNGCNNCACESSAAADGSILQLWRCDNEACINDEDLVRRVNNGRYGWYAGTYYKFDGVSLREGVRYYLGTIKPKTAVLRLNPIQIDSEQQFQRQFDSRDKWPGGYIHAAMDQGRCAASWAFSTTSVASDRWSIQSEGTFLEHLSVQNLISCNRFSDGCKGGRIEDAWFYLQKAGVVGDKCYPYTSGRTETKGTCSYLDELTCGNEANKDLHKTTPPYRISPSEREIMRELETQGPVQAVITVHPDFYLYQSGIYQHTREELNDPSKDHSLSDTHSVKIIGWGEENGVKFWLCVNSWGREWGDDGMVKIRRGANEIGIEEFVVGVWARVERHELHESMKKRRKHRRRRH